MNSMENEKMMAEQEENFLTAQRDEEGHTDKAQQDEKDCAAEAKAAEEALRREMKLLMEQYPELRERMANGEGMPQWMLRACAGEGGSLREAYAEHEMKQAKAEAEQLRRELEVFKQNAAMGGRAPVKGAAGNGGEKRVDPFLEGLLFNE